MAKHNPHQFNPPTWTKVSGVGALLFTGVGITLLWHLETIADWVLLFIVMVTVMAVVDFLHYRIVVKPIRIEWAIEHAKEYHPEDYEAMKDKFKR